MWARRCGPATGRALVLWAAHGGMVAGSHVCVASSLSFGA